MTPHTVLEELHATITTLIDERNDAVNAQARMDRINTCLREDMRILYEKLEWEILEGNRLRSEVMQLTTRLDRAIHLYRELTNETHPRS